MNQNVVLPITLNPSRDSSAAKKLGITHLDNTNLYISCEADIFLMIQTADTLAMDDHNPCLEQRKWLLYARDDAPWGPSRSPLGAGWKQLSNFPMIHETKIEKTK